METKQTHTPGPWRVQNYQRASLAEESIAVESASGRTVCDMGDYPNNEDAANAQLIASAPELLDFAIQVLYSLAGECAPHHCAAPYTTEELADMAREVIAKATE